MNTRIPLTILTTTILTSSCLAQVFETLPRKNKTAKSKAKQKASSKGPKTIIIDGTLYELRPIGKSPTLRFDQTDTFFEMDPARVKKVNSFQLRAPKNMKKGSFQLKAPKNMKKGLTFEFAKPNQSFTFKTPKVTVKNGWRYESAKPKLYDDGSEKKSKKNTSNSFQLRAKPTKRNNGKRGATVTRRAFGTARMKDDSNLSKRVNALTSEIQELKILLDRLESRLSDRRRGSRRELR